MEALFMLFLFGFFAIAIAGFVFWIIAIVEVVKIPEHQFRAASTEKLVWVLVVVLAGWLGALIWYLVKRRDVLAAAGSTPDYAVGYPGGYFGAYPAAPHPTGPSPGWYPEEGTGLLRWWDGTRWTEDRHQPPS